MNIQQQQNKTQQLAKAYAGFRREKKNSCGEYDSHLLEFIGNKV
jgi:hypothetical protein